MKGKLYITGIALLSTVVATNCASIENVRQTNINGRLVEFAASGEGSPAIVLETGMGPDIKTWSQIIDSLSSYTRVFAYNRPGYGHSNLGNPPQNIKEIAMQLRENLRATGQKPPYILVGHSAGGLYVNMYARLFPEEVAGVVFLDASHPDQFEYFRTHQPLLYSVLITSTTKGNRKYEGAIVKNTQSDFKNAPPFPEAPVVVLSAGKKSSPLERDEMRKKWLEFQKDLAGLSSNSKHVVVDGSGHYIHKDRPHLVIDEIIRLIDFKNENY
ncbi:MAG: alpha/beta hydrolase [Cytophagales bacterium]|nr:alpha/beta hydrolase [Cytophagales bacterium]